MSEMRYERQRTAMTACPPPQSVPTPEGWRHARTGELLVAIRSLRPAKAFTEYSHDTLLAALNGKGIDWEGKGKEGMVCEKNGQAVGTQASDSTRVSEQDVNAQPADSTQASDSRAEATTSHEQHPTPPYTPADSDDAVQPLQEGQEENSGGVRVDTTVFALAESDGGITVSLVAPYLHAQTKWTVNGVVQEKRGNSMVVAKGSAVVAKSAKGEWTVTV